ncbi:hypothetical protein A21D_02642 [Virgibacillus dokdonensis]|nr:hypothetical protein A21D_02642 [Virgibacillus dokdonensis]
MIAVGAGALELIVLNFHEFVFYDIKMETSHVDGANR